MGDLKETCKTIAGLMIAGATAVMVATTVIDAVFSELDDDDDNEHDEPTEEEET